VKIRGKDFPTKKREKNTRGRTAGGRRVWEKIPESPQTNRSQKIGVSFEKTAKKGIWTPQPSGGVVGEGPNHGKQYLRPIPANED